MAKKGDVTLRLGADGTAWNRALASATKDLNRFAAQAGGMKRALTGAFTSIGITAASAALATFVKNGAEAADEIGKLAAKVGVSTEDFSRLAYAAKISDLSTEQLATGLKVLSKNLAAAAGGSKAQRAAFEAMGFSAADVTAMLGDTGLAVRMLADKFASYEDGAAKAALAQEVLGKAGMDWLPFLSEGAAGIARLEKEADRAGATISDETAKAADQFNDALTRIDAIATGLAGRLAGELAGSVEALAGEFEEGAGKIDKFGDAAEDIADALRVIGSAALVMAAPLRIAAGALADIIRMQKDLWSGDFVGYFAGALKVGRSPRETMKETLRELEALWTEQQKRPPDHVEMVPSHGPGATKKPPPVVGSGGRASEAAKQAKEDAAQIAAAHAAILQAGADVEESLLTATQRYEAELDRLANLLEAGTIDMDTFTAATTAARVEFDQLRASQEDARKIAEAHAAVVAEAAAVTESVITPTEKYEAELDRLANLLEAGAISWETFQRATTQAREELDGAIVTFEKSADQARRAGERLSEFGARAAENIQDAFADSLFDGFKAGLDGMVDQFGQAIRRMVAEAAAAQILESLGVKAFIQGGLSFLGGLSGGGGEWSEWKDIDGARANGGPVSAGGMYLVGEKRPELFVPEVDGQILPMEKSASRRRSRASEKLPVQEHLHRFDPRMLQMTLREAFESLLADERATRNSR